MSIASKRVTSRPTFTTSSRVSSRMVRCRNNRRSDTGQPCNSLISPGTSHNWGLCSQCLKRCPGCGAVIPVFARFCYDCQQKLWPQRDKKPCRDCGRPIPSKGPNYCPDCGHECKGCGAFIPRRFTYCQRPSCRHLARWKGHEPPALKMAG